MCIPYHKIKHFLILRWNYQIKKIVFDMNRKKIKLLKHICLMRVCQLFIVKK